MRGSIIAFLAAGVIALALGCGDDNTEVGSSSMKGVSQEEEAAYYQRRQKAETASIDDAVLNQWFFDKKPSDKDFRQACGLLADGGWKFDEALSWYTNGKTAKLAEAIDKATHSGNVLAYCGGKGDLLKYEGFAEVQRLRAEGKLPRPSWENNGNKDR